VCTHALVYSIIEYFLSSLDSISGKECTFIALGFVHGMLRLEGALDWFCASIVGVIRFVIHVPQQFLPEIRFTQ
jgi:hypothetical protein